MKLIESVLLFRDCLTGARKIIQRQQEMLQELAKIKCELSQLMLHVRSIQPASELSMVGSRSTTEQQEHQRAEANRQAPAAADSRRLLPDIGFLVHNDELLNHFCCIWEAMPPDSFDVVLHGNAAESNTLRHRIKALGYRAIPSPTLLNAAVRYRYLVSNHPLTEENPPLIKQLGEKNIRFMYSAGKSGWNLSDWNRLYDLILCFGPYHADLLSRICDATILQMGYPRLDRLFTESFDIRELQRKFHCDPSKKTVVWLPTWRTLSSVGWFDQAMSSLMNRYNVVIKLHPLMPSDEPKRVAALERHNFTHVIKDATDNLPLYALADFVACDYGGPALAGIYADKNLLLLNVPSAASDKTTGADSPDILIRDGIVNVNPGESESIASILDSTSEWDQQYSQRRRLRSRFFAPYMGFSSTVVAAALQHLDDILMQSDGTNRIIPSHVKEQAVP